MVGDSMPSLYQNWLISNYSIELIMQYDWLVISTHCPLRIQLIKHIFVSVPVVSSEVQFSSNIHKIGYITCHTLPNSDISLSQLHCHCDAVSNVQLS